MEQSEKVIHAYDLIYHISDKSAFFRQFLIIIFAIKKEWSEMMKTLHKQNPF